MPRSRLGVAFVLDEPTRTEVLGLRRAVGCPSLFTQPPHITLVPPVNVRVDDIDQVLESTRVVCARSRSMRVRLGPLRTFAPVSPVVYLGVEGDDVPLIETLRSAIFTGPLLRKVSYSYVPHCTIHEDASPGLIAASLIAIGDYRRVVDLKSVDILRQDDDRVWRTLASFPLAPPTVRGRGGIEVTFSASRSVTPRSHDLLASYDRSISRETWCIEARSTEGSVIGVATGTVAAGVCTVAAFVVDELNRGLGIGRHLLTEVLLFAEAEGSPTLRVAGPEESWVRSWLMRRSFVAASAGEFTRALP